MGTPNQNFRSPNQPHQPNQTPPHRNPTSQYQQPNPQTNLNYNPKFTRNQSPNTPNIPNITNPQSFRTNFQQIPKVKVYIISFSKIEILMVIEIFSIIKILI